MSDDLTEIHVNHFPIIEHLFVSPRMPTANHRENDELRFLFFSLATNDLLFGPDDRMCTIGSESSFSTLQIWTL